MERVGQGSEAGTHCRAVPIVEQRTIAHATYQLSLACPAIARVIAPGQFVMLRVHDRQDPLIGRAFALYEATMERLDIVYLRGGKMTTAMAQMGPGDKVDLWGPLGNGFSLTPAEHVIMVAGGIGQTPFLSLTKSYLGRGSYRPPREEGLNLARKVTFCYGARTKDSLAGLDDFREAGADVRVATDDGSEGHHGLVTDLLAPLLTDATPQATRICCCGPEPMMAAVAELVRPTRIPLEVSLETPMACGLGICFSCVAPIRQPDGSWDYRRTCIEGPVFDGDSVVFA